METDLASIDDLVGPTWMGSYQWVPEGYAVEDWLTVDATLVFASDGSLTWEECAPATVLTSGFHNITTCSASVPFPAVLHLSSCFLDSVAVSTEDCGPASGVEREAGEVDYAPVYFAQDMLVLDGLPLEPM